MNLLEHLAVPYVLIAGAAQNDSGKWIRRAAYPELGCFADGDTLDEAMSLLDQKRTRLIVDHFTDGKPIPVPRRPLKSLMDELRTNELLVGYLQSDSGTSD